MKINGKWHFNETIPQVDVEFANIDFVSNGINYNTLSAYNMKPWGVEYGHTSGKEADMGVYFVDLGWEAETYRTIDFGAAYQEVSDEFYTWLTANAVQLSKPIPMTHPKGIRLLTKGKKCTEDIEVVPTFIESVSVSISENCGAEFTIICTTCDNGTLGGFLGYADNETVTLNNVLKGSVLIVQCGLENGDWSTSGDYKHIGDHDANRLVLQVNGDVTIKNK